MVQGLDETHDALLMIGYHSQAGSDANPLTHTISGKASLIRINGRDASEFLIHGFAAALMNVPIVFLSGDEGICTEAKTVIPNITTLSVKKGIGASTVSIHPLLAIEKTRESVERALRDDLQACQIDIPAYFELEISYKDHADAFHASFFPGSSLKGPHAIAFETDRYFEVLRLLSFVV